MFHFVAIRVIFAAAPEADDIPAMLEVDWRAWQQAAEQSNKSVQLQVEVESPSLVAATLKVVELRSILMGAGSDCTIHFWITYQTNYGGYNTVQDRQRLTI